MKPERSTRRDAKSHMRILGIETTCDETAAAVVSSGFDGRGEILSNEVLSQIAEHARYGGVVPEIAARAHVEVIDRLIARALENADCTIEDLDGIAVAAGPGPDRRRAGRAHHRQGDLARHPQAPDGGEPSRGACAHRRLTDGIGFPYLLLLASGGHTQLVAVRGVGDYVRLGTTIDDAIGEAFDKVAKLLGLRLSGRPACGERGASGNPERFAFPAR